MNGTIGIAHTRWATHGKPNKVNSHPHLDNSKTISVVHNGIIENCADIKKFLMDNGYRFLSETDTEVIPNLIHYYYETEHDFLKAVSLACQDLMGSYAIEILCADVPGTMIVAKKDSPLVIGVAPDGNYIASDIPAVLDYTKDFYLLEDNEIVELTQSDIHFYTTDLSPVEKSLVTITWDA